MSTEGIKPKTRIGKIGLGIGSFIADVAFDPLTYLTFGMAAGSRALKIGSQTLSKRGLRLAQTAGNWV